MVSQKAFIKSSEAPQKSEKIKIYVNFFSSFGIREGKIKNFFISLKSYVQFSMLQTIPSTSKTVTSWWLLPYETEYIVEYTFWILNHLVVKLGQLIDKKSGEIFLENLFEN